jgi:hypothetical protein
LRRLMTPAGPPNVANPMAREHETLPEGRDALRIGEVAKLTGLRPARFGIGRRSA